MEIFWGLAIPFIGTTLGAAMVFFMKNKMNSKIEKMLLGFSAGVMIAASVWSLLIPAIDKAEEQNIIAWVPATVGLLLGILFLLIIDNIIKHFHLDYNSLEGNSCKESEKFKSKIKKTTMMVLAIILHNIPEGMAVGVLFAGVISQNTEVAMAGAYAFSMGIAIQNFPEGAIVSMPLKSEGMKKSKAFIYGALSGIVEPIAAAITLLLTNTVIKILPYLLSFAAGTMIYVVVKEIIPESQDGEHSNIGIIGLGLGFAIMMILDVALG